MGRRYALSARISESAALKSWPNEGRLLADANLARLTGDAPNTPKHAQRLAVAPAGTTRKTFSHSSTSPTARTGTIRNSTIAYCVAMVRPPGCMFRASVSPGAMKPCTHPRLVNERDRTKTSPSAASAKANPASRHHRTRTRGHLYHTPMRRGE